MATSVLLEKYRETSFLTRGKRGSRLQTSQPSHLALVVPPEFTLGVLSGFVLGHASHDEFPTASVAEV
jgi:hypothetical protein